MHVGWEKTFHWLGVTGNRAAVEVLLRAVRSDTAEIRCAAILALMQRSDKSAHHAILKEIVRNHENYRQYFVSLPSAFQEFLRNELIHGPPEAVQTVCLFLVDTDQFDFVPLLCRLLENRQAPSRDILANTLLALCERLASLGNTGEMGPEKSQILRTAEQLRRALQIAADRYAKHESPEIVKGLILLAGGRSGLLSDIFRQPVHPARRVLLDLLARDTSPATLNLLCDFLSQPEVPHEVLTIISHRSDLAFVQSFLRHVGSPPSAVVKRHLKSLRKLKCVENLRDVLPRLDEKEQGSLVEVAVNSGLPRREALEIVGRVLTSGLPAARRIAAEALAEFHGAEANALALKAMSDPDPFVQAAILPQLRQRGVMGTLPHIIRLLESPHPAVRKAARKSLREFSFSRFLQVWDLLPPDIRQNTGMLVKRVDARTSLLLRAELLSPFRLRRLRGLSVAQELNLVARVESAIIPLLKDEDHAVRAEAAAALAQSDSLASYQALVDALEDPNAIVRAVAQRSLEQRRRRQESAPQQADGTGSDKSAVSSSIVSSSSDSGVVSHPTPHA